MTKKITMILAALVCSTTAFAQEGGGTDSDSTQFFQPDAGRQSAKAALEFGSSTIDMVAGGSVKAGTFGVSLQYLFGLNDDWALGVERLAYNTSSAESGPITVKSSGIEDVVLSGRGTMNMGAWNLHLGSFLGISPGKSKAGAVGTDGNMASGGMSITPYVGATFGAGPGLLGVRGSYALLMERETDTGVKTTGGNTLGIDVFYEWHSGNLFLIPQIGFNMASGVSVAGGPTSDSTNNMDFGVEGGWYLMPDTVIGASWTGTNIKETPLTKSALAHMFTVFGRMEF